MKRKMSLIVTLVLIFAVNYCWSISQKTNQTSLFTQPITPQDHHQLADNPATLQNENLHVVSTANRFARQGADVVWADDFETESLYYYYVGVAYYWENPTEYPEFAVRYTPYHSGIIEGAWFYWYGGDATEATLHFYDDAAGYPGTELATYAIVPEFNGWYYYDLSSMGFAVNAMEDIYMSFTVTGGTFLQIISDDGSGGANRSYVHDGTNWLTVVEAAGGDYEWNMDLVVTNTDPWTTPTGNWTWLDTNYHSETHSWWIPEGQGFYSDGIYSPIFPLPEGYNQYFISEWVDIEFKRSGAGPGSVDETFRLWMRNADDPTPDYWQITNFNAYDGNSWWCGIEDAGYQGGWGYGHNWDQYIETPAIDLTTAGSISLDFMTRWDSELNWDFGYIRISSNDFQTYDVLASYTGTNNTWTAQSIDLTAYANQTVKLRFRFISDSNTDDEDNLDTEGAWFVDNVVISDDQRTIFFQDDADTNVNFLINPGNVAWDMMYYDYDRDYPNPSAGWELIDKDHIYNGTADVTDYAGSNIQIRFTVTTDDSTYIQGAGCYVDDFEIVGSNMPPFDAACMFDVIPYPTTEDVDIIPGIVYGNLGQNAINPTLRMNIEGVGGPFEYSASNPGELESGEFGLGWLNPLPTTNLVEGNFDFTGEVIVGSDGNADNNTYTVNIDVNAPGYYELGYNSRFWDGTYYTSSYSGTYFTPFTEGLFTEFTINSVKCLMINYGVDNHVEVETIEIYEAIDDVTPGALIYTEDFDYTGAPPGDYHWAEFVLSEPQTLTADFFVMIGGDHTNVDNDYHILFDAMVRQYLGAGAYTIHNVYWDAGSEQWLHSSGDRFINAVGVTEMEDTNPPENVAVNEYTGLVSWDPPIGDFLFFDDFDS
ncbi:MAG: choice-of-anchor J domain-containing protein, partial [Candidatus Cloacimonetes bacterium]|nr:choice-of-anchor J domain-containing protein [Candidatus Cloacimonadota bacterium]